MKEKVIKVLCVAPHEPPKEVSLKNELTALQEAVSIGADYRGLIEVINLDSKTCIVANEEGKVIDLAPNRRLGNDILCGTFYVMGQDRHGNFTSLPEASMRYYADLFAEPEDILDSEVVKTIITKFFVI